MLSALTSLLALLLSLHHPVKSHSIKEHLEPVSLAVTPTSGSCTPHIVVSNFLNYGYLEVTPFTGKGEFKALILVAYFDSCDISGDLTILRNCSLEKLGPIRFYPVPCSDPEMRKKTENYYYSATMDPDLYELNCTTLVYSPLGPGGGTGNLVGISVYVSWTEKGNEDADFSENCVTNADSGGFCRYYFNLANLEDCKAQAKHLNKLEKILIIGGLPISGILILLIISLCYYRKPNTSLNYRKRNRKEKHVEEFIDRIQKLAPKRYTYSDVEKITSCFSDKLGQGGCGSVYRGQLEDGRPVAAKVLNDTRGSVKDFFTEVVSIGCTYHVNIVTMLGFCLEGTRRVLIYEFMANGSLAKFISDRKQASSHLDAGMLLEMATGVARGLEYLHHGCSIRILHFDIKPHNILLDEHFCPKIADFGLAKLCRSANRRVKMSGARGTVGYIAPEVFSRQYGAVSSKSDVYSFGMMVLEMVGGRSNLKHEVDRTSEICFPHWICRHLDLDGNLKSLRSLTEVEGEMERRMVIVGLQCIQMKPSDRPTMTKVLAMLEGRVTELQLPPMGSVDRIEGIQFPESINVSGPIAHVSESGSSSRHESVFHYQQ